MGLAQPNTCIDSFLGCFLIRSIPHHSVSCDLILFLVVALSIVRQAVLVCVYSEVHCLRGGGTEWIPIEPCLRSIARLFFMASGVAHLSEYNIDCIMSYIFLKSFEFL